MMLGGLEKQMFSNGLSPAPTTPFIGIGYQELVDKVRNFERPTWGNSSAGFGGEHVCTPSRYGYAQLKLNTDAVGGLNIDYLYF